MDSLKDTLTEINSKYAINIQSASKINRSDIGNLNTLLKLEGSNQSYFFKNVPSHSLRDELDQVYSELSLIKPYSFKMALPIRSKNNLFFETISNHLSSLSPFINHHVFNQSDIPVERISGCLIEFHYLIRTLNIPSHSFKTYENWFERGLQQLKTRIEEHPFLKLFEDFISNRFSNLRFITGNTHFDLNPFNVWISSENEIYFSDFDNSQPAALAKDYFDIMSKYLRIDQGYPSISATDLDEIILRSNHYVDGLQNKDVRFLLVRPKLGPLFDPNNDLEDEQIKLILNGLTAFVSH